MAEQLDDLVKKWEHLQEKISRYEKLSKNKTGKRTTKQNKYEGELAEAVVDLADLEKRIKRENQRLERKKKMEIKKLEAEKKKKELEAKKLEEQNKKVEIKREKVVDTNKKKIVKREKKLQEELKDVYCGARKPRKNKTLGTEGQCRLKGQVRLYGHNKVADRSGGNIDKKLVQKILMDSLKRKTVTRKGGKLAASIISKFIKASHDKDYHDVGDFKIDRDLSHEWVKVYYNPKNNQAVVVHRGSADKADAWTDFKLLFQQKNNNRFKKSEEVQKKAEQKYGAQNVTTIGSSLGGYLAEEFGQNSKEVITVSKPTTPLDVLKGKKKGDKQHDIRTTLDPIAILQNFQKGDKDVVIKSETVNPFENHMGDKVTGHLGDQMVGEGMLKRLKVKELKGLVKLLRKQKRGRARQYPITKTKKCDLCKMVMELKGGSLSESKQTSLWEQLNEMFSDKIAVPLFNYLIKSL